MPDFEFDLRQLFVENWYRSAAAQLYDYLANALGNVAFFLIFYTALCVFIYKSVQRKRRAAETFQFAKRALLVVAHPDDECMFFGPTILNLNKQAVQIYVLCLSSGTFYQKGNTRVKEMYEACSVLKLKRDRINICIDMSMPDDPNVHWPSDHVAKIILHHIETLSIDTLITFDKAGVSHHLNHSSIFYAVARLCIEKKFPHYCRVFTLDSINVFRKYWYYLDLPLSFLFSSHWFVLSFEDKKIVMNAMKKHKSQMVWFRYLYLWFSRYVVINTLRHVTLQDFELELQLDD